MYNVVLGRYWLFGLVPGFGIEASIPVVPQYRFLVPRFWFLLRDTRVLVQCFLGVICIFLILVIVRFQFGAIAVHNQVEPKALVLRPKLTGN